MVRAKKIVIYGINGINRLFALGIGAFVLLNVAATSRAESVDNAPIPVAQAEVPDPTPPGPNPGPNPVLLGPGANSSEVQILHQQLRQLGLYSGPVDAEYSAATQEAVKAFQASEGLTVTGWLDAQTWERMITPQLLGNAEAAAEPTEVPSLIATDPTEVPPPAENPPAENPPAENPPAENPAAESQSFPSTEPNGTTADTDSTAWPSRILGGKSRWFLAVPLAGVALLGLGWGGKRLLRARSAHHPAPGSDDLGSNDLGSNDLGNYDLGTVPDGGGSEADPVGLAPSGSSSSLAVPNQTEGHPSTPQSDMARLPVVNIMDTLASELASADAAVRHRAIWELGQRGNSAAIQPLVNSLMEADSQEKGLIFTALAEIGRRSLQPMQRALALGLQDSSPEVRKNAIRDLSRLYDVLGQIRPLMIHATQDPDPDVQATAQWALGQLSRPRPTPYMESSVTEVHYPQDRLPPSEL